MFAHPVRMLILPRWQEMNGNKTILRGPFQSPRVVQSGISLRMFAAPHEFFIGDSGDVIGKAAEWNAKVPFQHPMRVHRKGPCGRNRMVNFPNPPDRVGLVEGVMGAIRTAV